MVKKHLSRLAIPKSWPIKRKGIAWVARPLSSHKMEFCLPLSVVLRDLLHLAKNAKEAKLILNSGNVMVNKIVRKEPKFGVGLMDVIEFPKLNEHYRLLINTYGRLELHKITPDESALLPAKIIGKKNVKGGKTQLNLSGGINLLVDNSDYKVGDTLVLDTETLKVKEHLPFEKGAIVYIISGKMVGVAGKLESIREFKGIYPTNIIFVVDDKSYETRKDYAFVIGKDKPIISLV